MLSIKDDGIQIKCIEQFNQIQNSNFDIYIIFIYQNINVWPIKGSTIYTIQIFLFEKRKIQYQNFKCHVLSSSCFYFYDFLLYVTINWQTRPIILRGLFNISSLCSFYNGKLCIGRYIYIFQESYENLPKIEQKKTNSKFSFFLTSFLFYWECLFPYHLCLILNY